jgi:hypothetical protein
MYISLGTYRLLSSRSDNYCRTIISRTFRRAPELCDKCLTIGSGFSGEGMEKIIPPETGSPTSSTNKFRTLNIELLLILLRRIYTI